MLDDQRMGDGGERRINRSRQRIVTSLGLSYMLSRDAAPTSVMDRVTTPAEPEVSVITAPPMEDGLPAIPGEAAEAEGATEVAPEGSSLPPPE